MDDADLGQRPAGHQSQELPKATLALGRGRAACGRGSRRAREDTRAIVLTWAMRGTLHLVPTADLGWLLEFFGPLALGGFGRRFRELGLDADTRARATRTLRETLAARGPLTRPELAAILGAQGIPVAGQAIAYLVSGAALEGAICFGPRPGSRPTFVALESWLAPGEPVSPGDVLAALARCYLAGHGPAAPDDLAAWAGMPIGQARAGFAAIAGELVEARTAAGPVWLLETQAAWLDTAPDGPLVRLLPGYDSYLLGYRSRDFMVSPDHARRIHPGGGLIRPTVLAGGRAVGTWKLDTLKREARITVSPFERLDPALRPGLERRRKTLALPGSRGESARGGGLKRRSPAPERILTSLKPLRIPKSAPPNCRIGKAS
jgi:hypothetical protein